MKELLIYDMSCMMLRKMLAQTEDATEIAGDHARANMTIAMFLADRGGIEIVEEQLEHKGKQYTVVDVKVVDTQKAFDAAVELAQMVQEIKSTADGVKGRWLIDTYGKPIRNPEHLRRIKSNYAEIVGPVKVTALIFPYYNAVVDPQSGDVVDAVASWPSTIVEQFMSLRKLALSTEVA